MKLTKAFITLTFVTIVGNATADCLDNKTQYIKNKIGLSTKISHIDASWEAFDNRWSKLGEKEQEFEGGLSHYQEVENEHELDKQKMDDAVASLASVYCKYQ